MSFWRMMRKVGVKWKISKKKGVGLRGRLAKYLHFYNAKSECPPFAAALLPFLKYRSQIIYVNESTPSKGHIRCQEGYIIISK